MLAADASGNKTTDLQPSTRTTANPPTPQRLLRVLFRRKAVANADAATPPSISHASTLRQSADHISADVSTFPISVLALRGGHPREGRRARTAMNTSSTNVLNIPARTDEELSSLHSGAMELLVESQESLQAYLAFYFESNRRLRAELREAREEQGELERKFADAER
jgi:hypothetical protein